MDTELLTLREAAELARLSERTFRDVLARGAGPAVTQLSRGKRLIRLDCLKTWIDQRTQGATDA